MNALRHGLAAVSINTATADGTTSADDSCEDAIYQRLRQIEVERVKAFDDVHNLSRSEDLETAVRRLAALERYAQRSHSKLKKHIFLRTATRRPSLAICHFLNNSLLTLLIIENI
jgi:hypothetical protein